MITESTEHLSESARQLRQQFDELVAGHREGLWRYCLKLTGNPWDAEDLVQDTLLKAFGRLSFYWQPLNIRAYLFRIASNAWIDSWRRLRPAEALDGREPAAPRARTPTRSTPVTRSVCSSMSCPRASASSFC